MRNANWLPLATLWFLDDAPTNGARLARAPGRLLRAPLVDALAGC